MKNKYLYLIIAALVVALLFSIERCSDVHDNNVVNIGALTDTVKYYTNKLGTQTASIKTLQLDKKQMQSIILDKDKDVAALAAEFAKLKTVIKYQTSVRYDTIQVVYHDTVPCVFERTGHVADKWYSFGYKTTQKGFAVDSLTIPNTATVVTGFKRSWFLGKETVTTDITNTNPYIKVTGITAAELNLPDPWYKKWYLWLLAGAAGGFFAFK